MPRLRRAAHGPIRRGPCWSPCPRLRLAGSTPFGDKPPTACGSGSPCGFASAAGAFSKSFSSRPRRGKEQRGVAGDLLANRSTLPQPPRGRNACYGVLREGLHGRKQSVPGTPKAWQAGTPFGLCGAVAVEWALRARKSPFWRFGGVELSPTPIACAVGQIWGLGWATSVGGRAWS